MRPIAFIDSGIGGLPYLQELRSAAPWLPLVYVADTLNFPYGPKNEDEINAAVLDMTRRLVDRLDPLATVVACNTASVVSLDLLRRTFAMPFVGVVPAVKPAAAQTRSGVIAVMATERTVKGRYLDGLVNTYAKDKTVLRYPATALIRLIEEDPFMTRPDEYRSLLQEMKQEFLEKGVDVLVLGCTHFLHVEKEVQETLGADFTVLDSRGGVCRQTLRVLEELGTNPSAPGGEKAAASADFYITGPQDAQGVYSRVAQRFGLGFGGVL